MDDDGVLDSHCHLNPICDVRPDEGRAASLSSPDKPLRAVVFGTHPSIDWDALELLAASTATQEAAGDHIAVGFGIHPWFSTRSLSAAAAAVVAPVGESSMSKGDGSANAKSDDSSRCCCAPNPSSTPVLDLECALSRLRSLLERFPQACVGEIGLDKMVLQAEQAQRAGDPGCAEAGSEAAKKSAGELEAYQCHVFMAQMQIAAELRRPVSVHCVRSFGLLLDCLSNLKADLFPPAIVLHGFTGTPEFAKSLMKLPPRKSSRIYFGIGSRTTLRTKGCIQLLTGAAAIPAGRLLLETDGFLNWTKKEKNSCPEVLASQDVADRHVEIVDFVKSTFGDDWKSVVELSNGATKNIFFTGRDR